MSVPCHGLFSRQLSAIYCENKMTMKKNSRSGKNREQISNHVMFAETELVFEAYAVMGFARKTIQ